MSVSKKSSKKLYESDNTQKFNIKNQTFRDGLKKLQNSIEEPAAREENLRDIKN